MAAIADPAERSAAERLRAWFRGEFLSEPG